MEEYGVKMNGHGIVSELEVKLHLFGEAQVFEERTTGLHLFAEVAELQLWLGNLDHIGKARDKLR